MKDVKAIIVIVIFTLVLFSPAFYALYKDNKEHEAGYYIHAKSLSGKNAVVVEKKMESSGSGYFLIMKVRINDSIKYVEHVTPEIYNNYEVGDTIKRIETVYE